MLGEVERRHQEPLRALDELAVLERLLRTVDLRLQLLELGVTCGSESDRGLQLAGVNRLRLLIGPDDTPWL